MTIPSNSWRTADVERYQHAAPLPPTRVIHVRNSHHTQNLVYIGRATGSWAQSDWANPFRIGPDGNRDAVIARYAEYIQTRPDLLARVGELKGHVLCCWCAPNGGVGANDPLVCHGQILARLADTAKAVG